LSDFELPVTRYAQSGDINIAYQVMGNGPVDIILIPGFISHVEFAHEFVGYTSFLRRLSAFARVVVLDKRGQGLSDRARGIASLEMIPVERGRELAEQIRDARIVEYPGAGHAFWHGDVEALLGDVEEFVTGAREGQATELDRVLATVLFTDIVDSTRSAAELGDQTWRRLLDSHDQLAKQMVEKHRGSLIKSTGDGVLATFDGPGRAVRCALSFGAAARQIGLPLRAGLHTGEIEIRGRDIGGIAVHAAARVMAQSQPDEVLVSRVVTDLVAGAGLKFRERGSYELKGLPGRWELFAAAA